MITNQTKQPDIVLASQSPFRKQLMERLGIPFQGFSPNIDENAMPGEKAGELVKRLSLQKAQTYSSTSPAVVIGSDQVGCINNTILGKPLTNEKAIEQLETASGNKLIFYTGIAVINTVSNEARQFLHTTEVYFRNLSKKEIHNYVQKEQPLQSCGSFQVEGLGITLTEKIISDDPTGLIGLPLIHLSKMLRSIGVELP